MTGKILNREALQNFLDTRLEWPGGTHLFLFFSQPKLPTRDLSLGEYLLKLRENGVNLISKVAPDIKKRITSGETRSAVISEEGLQSETSYDWLPASVKEVGKGVSDLFDCLRIAPEMDQSARTEFSAVDRVRLQNFLRNFQIFLSNTEESPFRSSYTQLTEDEITLRWRVTNLKAMFKQAREEAGLKPEDAFELEQLFERVKREEEGCTDPVPEEARQQIIERIMADNERHVGEHKFEMALGVAIMQLAKDANIDLGKGRGQGLE